MHRFAGDGRHLATWGGAGTGPEAHAVPDTARVIPAEIEGIWASEDARIDDNGLLWEGAALYVDAHGDGALVGGPPPIGVRARMSYHAETRVVRCVTAGRGEPETVELTYHPESETLRATQHGETEVLHRHADHLSDAARRSLELDPDPR